MSRFYSTSNSERNKERNHGGRKSLSVHTRGWNLGVKVVARINEGGLDCFDIYDTTGTNNSRGSHRLIKTLIDKSSAGPRNRQGQLK